MIKALFFDFYGTIVHEDGVVIDEIPYIIMPFIKPYQIQL